MLELFKQWREAFQRLYDSIVNPEARAERILAELTERLFSAGVPNDIIQEWKDRGVLSVAAGETVADIFEKLMQEVDMAEKLANFTDGIEGIPSSTDEEVRDKMIRSLIREYELELTEEEINRVVENSRGSGYYYENGRCPHPRTIKCLIGPRDDRDNCKHCTFNPKKCMRYNPPQKTIRVRASKSIIKFR